MPEIIHKRMRDGTIKEVRFGQSVTSSRARGNAKDYFYKQDRGELKGGEIRRTPLSTHRFNQEDD